MKRAAVAGAFALVAVSSGSAGAQTREQPQRGVAQTGTGDQARAESLFNDAKQLQEKGQLAEACPKFAESKRLALGVGVTLHLGDCYERMGRTASAWAQYRNAEDLARVKRDDKRAKLAHERAQGVEPKVNRLTMATKSGTHEGWKVQLDGDPVPPQLWNAALAVDPGDHAVTITAPAKPLRALKVHLDTANSAATLNLDESEGAAAGVAVAPAPATGPATESAPIPASTESSPPPHGARSFRPLAELGLIGVGAVGVGLGAAFLVKKNQSMSNGDAHHPPSEDNAAAVASAIGFSIGAAALASAVVVYLTTPSHPDQVGVTLSPSVLAGGGGALLRASF